MHHPVQTTSSPSVSLPLKFTGGFGIDSRRIGAIFTIYSIICMLFQFLLFPPLTRRLGVLHCLRISFLIYPAAYFVTPFLSLLPTSRTRELGILFVLVFRGLAGTFAFPTSTIMITNSAPSLRVLGTINGLATSVSAVGRAAGPALGGNLFTYGVKHGYVVIPFWALSVLAILAFVPTLWLVEGDGFGDDAPSDDEDSSSSINDSESTKSIDLDSAPLNDPPSRKQTQDETALESESEYGEPTQLLRTLSTRSSEAAVLSDYDGPSDVEEAESRRHHRERRHSHSQRSQSRRRSRSVRARSSVPIGMGLGFRRLSSNLGSTGVGAGGAAWSVD